MHTAVTEITRAAGASTAVIRIRVFADDFGAVVRGTPGTAIIDSAMSGYVRGRLALQDRSGRPLPLRWIGARQDGDVLLLSLEAPSPDGLAGSRVFTGLLTDRFEDQINIVRATYDGRTTTLLFTPGDAPKVLP
jgi:hypothetical protein